MSLRAATLSAVARRYGIARRVLCRWRKEQATCFVDVERLYLGRQATLQYGAILLRAVIDAELHEQHCAERNDCSYQDFFHGAKHT